MNRYYFFALLLGSISSAQGQLMVSVPKALQTAFMHHQLMPREQINATWTADTTPTFAVYSKFDFVPGESIVFAEDFSTATVGDFPAGWNTNAGGEVVTITGPEGKWLKLDAPGVFMPERIKKLPENFTLEFDLVCNPDFRSTSSPLFFAIASLKSPQDYTVWLEGNGGRNGFNTWLLPRAANGNSGKAGYQQYANGERNINEFETDKIYSPSKNTVKVSVWRQKQRLRIYLDEQKILDVARALPELNYNALVFSLNSAKTAPDYFLLSNIRLASGQPDLRNKLLTEGRLVTSAIQFSINSDQVQPSSYPVIKEIAATLIADPGMRVQIIGHTDSEGDGAANLVLSEKRALAVKNILVKEFQINGERIKTGGKGESQPLASNDTPTGRAQNRRVEFVKVTS